jgi:hypothetical protein
VEQTLTEYRGTDPQHAVSVVVDRAGRVTAVRPSARWTELIEPDQLGASVLSAVEVALTLAAQEWTRPPVARRPGPPERPTSTSAPIDPMALLDELMTAFDALGRQAEQLSTRAGSPTRALGGDANEVSVTMSEAGLPVSITVDAAWSQRVSLNRLSERFVEAFDQAYRDLDHTVAQRREDTFTLSPQLRALAADPGGALHRYVDDLRHSLS